MNNSELFDLYKLVQNGDRNAQNMLMEEHKKKYPSYYAHHIPKGEWHNAKEEFHRMYLHLTNKNK